MRARSLGLAFCALIVAAASAVACSGGGGYGDDDDGLSPTPTPGVDYCRLVWEKTAGAFTDAFLVDAPIAAWTTGTKNYAVNAPIGVFYRRRSAGGDAESAAVTTSGQFSLVLGLGTTPGGSVQFDDQTTQVFYALNQTNGTVGAQVGTGGIGTFAGEWSDPAQAPTVVPGNGTISIRYLGTNLEVGGAMGAHATCYDHAAAASVQDRIRGLLEPLGPSGERTAAPDEVH